MERLGISRVKSYPIDNAFFTEGISVHFGKTKLVDFGLVQKKILKQFDIAQDVLFADFYWENVIEIAKHNTVITSYSIHYTKLYD